MAIVEAINLLLPDTEVHLAGSSIDGQLVLKLGSTLMDAGVKVQLIGKAFLRWLEDENAEHEDSQRTAYTNQAVYISEAKDFHIEGGQLASGVYTFDFHFSFPPNVPSTFNSRIGYISYFLEATCSSHQIVLAKEKRCLLLQGIAGNHRRHMEDKGPVVVEAREDVVRSCCSRYDSVTLQISLEKSVFSPGETFSLKAVISNRSCKYVRKIVFALHCIVLYSGFSSRGERRSLERQSEVARLEFQTHTAPRKAIRFTIDLALPKPMPVTSTLMENKLMAFSYELVGTSDLPGTTSTVVARVPIIIAAASECENRGDISRE